METFPVASRLPSNPAQKRLLRESPAKEQARQSIAMLLDPTLTAQIRDWLFSKALPFWAEAGVDRRFGGFIEELDFSGADAALPHKRVRVTCRQIYAFSQASLLGWTHGAHLIDDGAAYLVDKAWQGEDGGFARTLARNGTVADPTADLYEQAFALFAFAYAYKATGNADYAQWAHKTMDFIEAHLRDADGEGFWHASDRAGHRQQNPHMHLAEACLAGFDATGEARFAERGREVIALFENRFFDRKTGVLHEFFKRDWSVAEGEDGRIVEPGHQLEWAWLLQNAHARLGAGRAQPVRALIGYAERRGVNPKTGAVMNRIDRDGAPIDAGSRSWPNTERIKAALALYELDGEDPSPVVEKTARLLFERYLRSAPGLIEIPQGAWIDAFDGEGRPVSERIPASILYHLTLAFAEVLRLEEASAAGEPIVNEIGEP